MNWIVMYFFASDTKQGSEVHSRGFYFRKDAEAFIEYMTERGWLCSDPMEAL